MHRLAAWYLDYKPPATAAIIAAGPVAPAQPDAEAVAAAASMMAERPLDATQQASLAILKAKGLA